MAYVLLYEPECCHGKDLRFTPFFLIVYTETKARMIP